MHKGVSVQPVCICLCLSGSAITWKWEFGAGCCFNLLLALIGSGLDPRFWLCVLAALSRKVCAAVKWAEKPNGALSLCYTDMKCLSLLYSTHSSSRLVCCFESVPVWLNWSYETWLLWGGRLCCSTLSTVFILYPEETSVSHLSHVQTHSHTLKTLIVFLSLFHTLKRNCRKKNAASPSVPSSTKPRFCRAAVRVCVCVHSLCQAWGTSLCRYRLTLISGFVSLSFTLLISSSEATPDVPRESAPSGQVSCSSLTRVARCVLIMWFEDYPSASADVKQNRLQLRGGGRVVREKVYLHRLKYTHRPL